MLDIYLFEPDKDHIKRLREICVEYSIKHNIEPEIYCFDVIPESICGIEVCGCETSLYMIKSCNGVKMLAASISETNPENYIILIANDLNDIMACISADLRPSGVLIKPVGYEETERIFNDIFSDFRNSNEHHEIKFRFKIRSREYSIPLGSILYFEAMNKKMALRTSGQEFEFYMPMEKILEQLPDSFVRIHKGYIVNSEHISVTDYKNMTVELDNGSVIYISRTYKNNLQAAFAEKRKVDKI